MQVPAHWGASQHCASRRSSHSPSTQDMPSPEPPLVDELPMSLPESVEVAEPVEVAASKSEVVAPELLEVAGSVEVSAAAPESEVDVAVTAPESKTEVAESVELEVPEVADVVVVRPCQSALSFVQPVLMAITMVQTHARIDRSIRSFVGSVGRSDSAGSRIEVQRPVPTPSARRCDRNDCGGCRERGNFHRHGSGLPDVG